MLKYLGADIEMNGNSTTVSASKLTARDIEFVDNFNRELKLR